MTIFQHLLNQNYCFIFFIGEVYCFFIRNICLPCVIKPWFLFPICFFCCSIYHIHVCVAVQCTVMSDLSQTSLSFTISWRLLKLMSIESMMPCIHLLLCNPFSSCLQSFPASESFLMNQLFSSGGQNWSFSFSISPSMNIQD